MRWKKKGLIYCAQQDAFWKNQFAMLPTPLLMEDKLRIFVGFCDANNVGRIGYVDVKPENPKEIIAISENPVLDIGRAGSFDDNGVVPISIIRKERDIFLYYVGFQLGVKVPYYMFGGLAISRDNGEHFERYSEAPVLDRRGDEIFARCGINVIRDKCKYKMWYIGSNKEGWTVSDNKLKPLYIMKYTESEDGINWNKDSVICMEYKNEDEHGFGRPFVWKENGVYKMMYSIRTYSRGYYIGYAESKNGIEWDRKDEAAGISLGPDEWESVNLSYPYIFNYKEHTYLFYNGNGCGKSGFGYAELIKS
nr:hypothetical protein [uncultured Eisenbergiella sp.]